MPQWVRPPAPNEEDYEPHINPDTYEGEIFQETRLSKKRFKNRYTSPQNMEADGDSESDSDDEEEPEEDEPEQEEPKQEEVTAADDLLMSDWLEKGLPDVDAAEPDKHVIHDDTRDCDDDDAFRDPGEDIPTIISLYACQL